MRFLVFSLSIIHLVISSIMEDTQIEDPSNRGIFEGSSTLMMDLSLSHPHMKLSAIEIIQFHGFEAEVHRVKTEDGYEIEMHRMLSQNYDSKKKSDKPPILLMHGILSSSADWIIAGPDKSLAFILSKAGYDVWMGNCRGNKYSRKHSIYRTESTRFWNFSWHEIGIYDIPAFIDHILKTTGHEKLYYIGHSQGTTVFYVMASQKPEYNDKIIKMISMAPVSHSGRMHSPVFRYFAKFVSESEYLFKMLGFNEIRPTPALLKKLTSWACNEESSLQRVCLNYLFQITGYNYSQMNNSLLPAILSHVPAGASVKQFVHYAQIINAGKFQMYDYKRLRNLKIYGTPKAPMYNLSMITAPVALYYSNNDWLCHPQDVHKLHEQLPNSVGKFLVPHEEFNHLDYLYGVDANDLIYKNVMRSL